MHHPRNKKIIAVLPAYNAAKTIRLTAHDIPRAWIDEIILVDDGSSDETVKIARELGLRVFRHSRNRGYGANQKTCYRKAIQAHADIIIMIHPNHQFGSRMITPNG